MQFEYIQRAEKLLAFLNSFTHLKDGLSKLKDKEIILQANITPRKLKESMRNLMIKIEKLGIKLNSNGKVYNSINRLIIHLLKMTLD